MPVDATVASLMGRLVVLEELVRWLSLPYGVNEPVFAGADGQGLVNGTPAGQAGQMHTLWHQVTGTDHTDGPRDDTRWEQCPACKQWAINSGGGI